MSRPEFMLRPTAPVAPLAPLSPTRATAPTAATAPFAASGGASFGALFGSVRDEVSDFLERGSGPAAPTPPALATLSPEGERVRALTASAPGVPSPAQAAFVADLAPAAEEAARQLGVAPELVVAHAALESGWGHKPLRHADGSTSHNLFGIKATGGWTGAVVEARTTEFEDGVPVPRTERFRSYPDAQAAFRDYAQLLIDNPRYRGALHTGSDVRSFAEALARGGYATDPAYADKLASVARRVVGQGVGR